MSLLQNIQQRIRNREDLGIDHGAQRGRQRTINTDGSYNMKRETGKLLGNFHLFHWLINCRWSHFWLVVFLFYGFMNILFASLYFLIGTDGLSGMQGDDAFTQFLYCFFFSAQSFTTVGYGGIHPLSKSANLLASFEAFIGIATFAITTGTLYARFSKPRADLKFSRNIIIAPYEDKTALMFMVANQSESSMVEMEARVNMSWIEDVNGVGTRVFDQLKLEVEKIAMFPTSWTLVHPINEESPLLGKTLDDILRSDAEVFILLKGFDETFSQTIYSRSSYTAHELVWGAKFRRPFHVREDGKLIMDLTKVGEFDVVSLPA